MAGWDEETPLLGERGECSALDVRRRRVWIRIGVPFGIIGALLVAGLLWNTVPGGYDLISSGSSQTSEEQLGLAPRARLNFLAVGDWGRLGMYNQSSVAQQMGMVGAALDVDFVVSTGDNFYKDGLTGVDDPAFKASFSDVYTAESLQKPWHLVLGNHDYHGDVLAQLDPAMQQRDWRWNCTREGRMLYTIDKEDLLELFFIDTTPFVDDYWKPGGKHEFDWRDLQPRKEHLEHKLEYLTTALNSSTATWRVIVGHHTIRSYGNHGDCSEMVQRILPILEANNVDMYINGHDHCLEHVKREDSPIHFITSGGGSKAWKGIQPGANADGLQFYYDGQGFVSVSVSQRQIHVRYYDINGKVIHRVRLSKTH